MINKDELRKLVSEIAGDVVQHLLKNTVQSVMHAEAETVCSVGFNERNVERTNSFNGSRTRP